MGFICIGGRKIPAEYLACVSSMVSGGKSKSDAQRICAISFFKKHGMTPSQAEKLSDNELKDKIKIMLTEAIEHNNKPDNSGNVNKGGGKSMEIDAKKFEKMQTQLKELTDKVEASEVEKKTLAEKAETEKKTLAEKVEADSKVLAEKAESLKKELEDQYKTEDEKRAKELEDTNKRLEDTEKLLADGKEELRKEKVEQIAKTLLIDGIWPAVIEKAKRIMLSDKGENTFKLSDDEGDKKAPELSLTEAISDILRTIPESARVSYEEKTGKTGNDKTKKFMDVKEVAEYAKKEELSYEDACVALLEDGRIEDVTFQH